MELKLPSIAVVRGKQAILLLVRVGSRSIAAHSPQKLDRLAEKQVQTLSSKISIAFSICKTVVNSQPKPSNRANGGNVRINAVNGFVVAASGANGNNDIIASADRGNGGQVQIDTQSIFGLEPRRATPANNGTNDIDVSSRSGLQGQVTLNVPNVDPSRGLTELPTAPIDTTNQLSQVCPTNTQQADRLGSFIVSGRGGLPPSPTDLLSNDNILSEWVTPGESGHVKAEASPAQSAAIVEAQGWIKDANGAIRLVAQPTTPPASIVNPEGCRSRS